MKPWLDDGDVQLYNGDCLVVMAAMPEASVDAVVCDPPYGLGFMGKDWDSPGGTGDFPMRRTTAANTVNTGVSRQGGRQRSCADFARRQARDAQSFQAWSEAWVIEALRVLKPGGQLLAFGGTRTFHRLACAIEDAGLEIRDVLCWLYGSGFPKSRNIGDGLGTALKPAYEPIVLARKPLVGTVAANVAEHGTGALNIDACRIDTPGRPGRSNTSSASGLTGTGGAVTYGEFAVRGSHATEDTTLGRWPANVVLDQDAAERLDAEVGDRPSGNEGKDGHFRNQPPRENGGIYGGGKGLWQSPGPAGALYGDDGGPSRFFYTSKASSSERDGNTHPTVKPVDLMRWLIRLVTPPRGLIVDPFLGSGTTAFAARLEGVHCIGVELNEEYLQIAARRLGQQSLFAEAGSAP